MHPDRDQNASDNMSRSYNVGNEPEHPLLDLCLAKWSTEDSKSIENRDFEAKDVSYEIKLTELWLTTTAVRT